MFFFQQPKKNSFDYWKWIEQVFKFSLLFGGNTPGSFVLQTLEPTGGEILYPMDWHFVEGHPATSWMWTISKEDTEGGKLPYETGVRIQAAMKVFKPVRLAVNIGFSPKELREIQKLVIQNQEKVERKREKI